MEQPQESFEQKAYRKTIERFTWIVTDLQGKVNGNKRGFDHAKTSKRRKRSWEEELEDDEEQDEPKFSMSAPRRRIPTLEAWS